VRLPEAGGRFSFTSTPVTTTRGTINVEMAGTIDRWRSPAGGEFLVLTVNRVVTGANLPPAGLSSMTSAPVPMPGAEEVLSFEMVGSAGRGGAATARGGGGGGAAFGGTGGGGVARGTGGATGGGGGTTAAATPQGRGGGGGGGGRGGARGGVVTVSPAQLATLLEGHQFSLRMRITPIN